MANRYSNLTPSAYTPLTLEEIAMVPAMKRKQHDQVLSQQELIRSGLAKVDPYSKHFDEALRLKNEMESKIDATATELSQNGINNDMIGKTIGLNREFQDLVSPTGKLGQINAEKQNILKLNEDYDKLGKEKNWSQETLDYWKNKALKEYNESPIYNDKGRLNTYTGPQGIANKIDYAKAMDAYAGNAKLSTNEFAQAAQQLSQDEASGQDIVKGSSISKKYGSNYKAVLDAYNTMKREMSDPTSEIYKSIKYEGRNPQELLKTMASQSNIYKQKVSEIDRKSTIDPYNPTKAEGDGEGLGSGTIISNDSTLQSNTAEHATYTDALNEVKRLAASKGKLSPADAAKLDDLNELRRDADSKLNKNKDFVALNVKRKSILDQAKKLGDQYKIVRKPGMSDSDYISEIRYNVPTFNGKSSSLNAAKLGNDLRQLDDKYTELKNKAWSESSSTRHNYSYMPSTPKEESEWNLHNENIYNTLKGVPSLGNILDLTSIATPSGNRKDLNSKDVTNVQDLLKNGDPKTFKINNIKTYGDGKTPEITMTFNTGKGASDYDIEGSTEAGGDEYGGAEKPVTVTFKLKKFSNAFDAGSAAGYKSLSGAIADFWKNKGGINEVTGNFQGSEVSNALIENEYAGVSDKELTERAMIDSDAREALMLRITKAVAKNKK